MAVLDDVRVLRAVEGRHRPLRVLGPQVGVGRVDQDGEGVGDEVERVQGRLSGQLKRYEQMRSNKNQ